MHITLVAVGKSKLKEEKAWSEDYLKRLPWKFALAELPESKAGTAELRKADEAARMQTFIDKADVVFALDERGLMPTSREFAGFLQTAGTSGKSKALFIIGGADGLCQSIAKQADYTISFGKMTLPHLMVRLMVIEQIYRAYTIISNHPYHRD